MEYALEICNAVIDVWKPRPERKVIINLPATVSMSMPHVYASQIEYMSKNLHDRDNVLGFRLLPPAQRQRHRCSRLRTGNAGRCRWCAKARCLVMENVQAMLTL